MKTNLRKTMSFAVRETFSKDKWISFFSMLNIPFSVLNRLVDVYLVALLVDAAAHGNARQLTIIVAAYAGYKLLAEVVQRLTEWQLSTRNYRGKMLFMSEYASKYMRTDFMTIESTTGKDMAQRGKNAMAGVDYRQKSAVETFFTQSAELISNVLGLFVYAGIITILNPLIIVLLLITSGISYMLQKYLVRYDQQDKVRYIPIERRLWYLVKEMRNLAAAKDIKIYGLKSWLQKTFAGNLEERMRLHRKRSHLQYTFVVVIQVVNTAFTAFIYYYLIRQFLQGGFDIAQFLLYFGLITGFNTWLTSVVDVWEGLHATVLNIEDLRQFQEVPERRILHDADRREQGGIICENISFGYEEGKDVIRKMDFHIRTGEKIAIVGVNGAGKTTLVKLLCGLYVPKKGKIFIDGQDTRSMDLQVLFEKIAVVFQDIYLLPTTIERNITLSDQKDADKLRKVLQLSGLQEKINRLAEQEQTVLVKSVLENAIDLSGGEQQKLALARALYKGGEFFILDEPTAALDPIAESEMYQRYSQLTEGKTSIFISHRLSSTRFCDRIFFLENGEITESGSHEELMAMGGSYAEMFETQSQYYKEVQS